MTNASLLKPGHFAYYVIVLQEAGSYLNLATSDEGNGGGGCNVLLLTGRARSRGSHMASTEPRKGCATL